MFELLTGTGSEYECRTFIYLPTHTLLPGGARSDGCGDIDWLG